jgi:hypothetical protein
MGDSMSTIINATTTNGVVIQPDNSGSLVLQTNNGTTALTVDTSQNTTFAKNIVLNGSTSGTVTLAAPSVSGTTTLTLPTTSGTVITTASTFGGTGPAFSAYNNAAAQSLSNATWTKLICNAEEFDTASCFDSTTNYRFTPNIAGYYQVNLSVFLDYSVSQFNAGESAIYKNGASFKRLIQNGYGGYGIGIISTLIYMNGTTDYLEGYAYISGGSGPQIYSNSSASLTNFQASLVRSA